MGYMLNEVYIVHDAPYDVYNEHIVYNAYNVHLRYIVFNVDIVNITFIVNIVYNVHAQPFAQVILAQDLQFRFSQEVLQFFCYHATYGHEVCEEVCES